MTSVDRSPSETETWLTIDELSARVGTTVRTTRYYASLGLIPPPQRRGRVAFYGDVHIARLEMVRALQEHGFTLQAIERYLGSLPAQASTEDLMLQRAMLTAWSTEAPRRLSRAQLHELASRELEDDDVELLLRISAIQADDDAFLVLPGFALSIEILDLGVPADGLVAATEAIERHMGALADELTAILRDQVVRPYRAAERHGPDEAASMERTVSALRRITLEAVVVGFRRAADEVIRRSLQRR